MKMAIDTFIENRTLANIDFKNTFVFARGGHSLRNLRGQDCLRLFCNELDLQQPQLLTSTKLRKYCCSGFLFDRG